MVIQFQIELQLLHLLSNYHENYAMPIFEKFLYEIVYAISQIFSNLLNSSLKISLRLNKWLASMNHQVIAHYNTNKTFKSRSAR